MLQYVDETSALHSEVYRNTIRDSKVYKYKSLFDEDI